MASLVQILLGCSREEAERITHEDVFPDELEHAIAMLQGKDQAPAELEALKILPEFRPITATGSGRRFYQYLEDRGFDEVDKLVDTYELWYALTGPFAYRVILPFYLSGRLVAWTGRAIVPAEIRYRSHPAGNTIKQTLWNFDDLKRGGNTLYVVEGPFDALKLDWLLLGLGLEDRAVPMLGTWCSSRQAAMLLDLSDMFREVVILLDSDAQAQALELAGKLALCRPIIGKLPDGVKDPGELTERQVRQLRSE